MKIALFGAGGKMGYRLAKNLKGSRFDVAPCRGQRGRAAAAEGRDRHRLRRRRTRRWMAPEVVILAVPDTQSARSRPSIERKLKPGTMVVVLDAAAPFAGHLPERADLTYFVTHPCHPPIFNDETDMAAKKDHFGGIAAKQHIVSALMQGPEEHYAHRRGDRQDRSGRRSCARTA